MSKKTYSKFDSDAWLLRSAYKWGYDLKLEEITPEYFEKRRNEPYKITEKKKQNNV